MSEVNEHRIEKAQSLRGEKKHKTKTYTLFGYFLLAISLSSCIKDEVTIPAPQPGVLTTMQIEVGYPYLNQVYYDCETNKVVSSNTKYDWDLSFECSPEGYHILLNTAKGMLGSNEGKVSFSAVTNIDGAIWLWDAPSGNQDSTAIGDWRNTTNVYIIDRQFDANGSHLGYKKLQIQAVKNQSFSFKYANLDGSDEVAYTLLKNDQLNFIHFSFDGDGQTLALEPQKDTWDLLFTNHYHKFSNLPMPFVLTQTLTNKHNGVLVAEDNNNNFFNITLSDTLNYTFTNEWDEIGYDWKTRNGQDNSFTIDPNKSFIVKITTGLFYKLRFIDFYNESGVKGYPTFEIQKL